MTRSDVRSSWHITLSVWHALLLREAVSRMFSRRSALLWLLLEPVVHILVLALIFSAIRVRHIGGMDTGLWIAAGMLRSSCSSAPHFVAPRHWTPTRPCSPTARSNRRTRC